MNAASTSLPVVLGPTLSERRSSSYGPSRQTLVSVKYNFKAPSIPKESVGLLHCPKRSQSEWLLEYSAGSNSGSDQESGAHGFIGTQSTVKDVDCVLVWNENKQAYVLDRLASSFSLKLDRGHAKLSKTAQDVLPDLKAKTDERKGGRTSALGLDIPAHELESSSRVLTREDQADGMEVDEEEGQDNESDDFARQLQYDLEAIGGEDEGGSDEHSDRGARQSPSTRSSHAGPSSPKGRHTGLGLIGPNGIQEDVITPRGSPFIDRSTRVLGSAVMPSTSAMRATPAMSPVSVATSPRTTGLESSLSSTWRPPAQRSNVALAFDDEEDDDDDDESDEDDDDDDDDDDEEDEDDDEAATGVVNATSSGVVEDDDDDLDAFARQLEGSLMEPPTPIEEKQAKQPRQSRRSSTRSKK